MPGVTESLVDSAAHPAVAAATAHRADLMAATEANYRAVIFPRDPGGLSREERLALASRIARLNGEAALAAHYQDASEGYRTPANHPRFAAMLRHAELVTRSPRDATPGDIAALRAAGISDADIVRLSQLIAFVNYQVRLIAGLRLIGAAP